MTAPIADRPALPERRAVEPSAVPRDPVARHRGFEREFERAIVDAWFSNGPVAPRAGPATRAPAAASNATSAEARTPSTAMPATREDGAAAPEPTRRSHDDVRTGARPSTPAPAESGLAATHVLVPAATLADGHARPPDRVEAAPRPHATPPVVDRGVAPLSTTLRTADADVVSGRPPAAPSAPGPRADEPPPIRLHVETDPTGAARVWLGVDASARDAGGRVVDTVRETLLRSGVRVRAVVVNGAPLGDAAPSAPPRQDP